MTLANWNTPSASSQESFLSWKWQMAHRIQSLDQLEKVQPNFQATAQQKEVAKKYPFSITPYYASLINTWDDADPIFRMAIPSAEEGIPNPDLFRDPLGEESHSPVPGLLHRYPDRAVVLVNGVCPVYCRHCTRKRFVGIEKGSVTTKQLESWVGYLKKTPQIKDVILSGGDPLTLGDAKLERILAAIRSVKSVEIIRIGTRIPVLMPMRVTPELCRILENYGPVWVVTHFNHSVEVTDLAVSACDMLLRHGIPVNNQSVLLRGVNDHPDIIEDLCRKLVRNAIRPYYLHQCDLIQGIEHLRTTTRRGLEIMEALRGRLGGIAIPQYVIELPKGGGKVPLLPNYIVSTGTKKTIIRNFEGRIVSYPEPNSQNHEQTDFQGKPRGGISDLVSGRNNEALIPEGGHWKLVEFDS